MRASQALEGIVIGQRQDPHTLLERPRNQRRGREGAIGSSAVAVQINIMR